MDPQPDNPTPPATPPAPVPLTREQHLARIKTRLPEITRRIHAAAQQHMRERDQANVPALTPQEKREAFARARKLEQWEAQLSGHLKGLTCEHANVAGELVRHGKGEPTLFAPEVMSSWLSAMHVQKEKCRRMRWEYNALKPDPKVREMFADAHPIEHLGKWLGKNLRGGVK